MRLGAGVVVTTASASRAAKMGASSSFFALPMAPQPTPAIADTAAPVLDELEKYSLLPVETNLQYRPRCASVVEGTRPQLAG